MRFYSVTSLMVSQPCYQVLYRDVQRPIGGSPRSWRQCPIDRMGFCFSLFSEDRPNLPVDELFRWVFIVERCHWFNPR